MISASRIGLGSTVLAFGLCLVFPGRATALDSDLHRHITGDTCGVMGLPEDFCRRAALAAHDVDAFEWSDLTAHAQAAVPEDLCGGANAAAAHVAAVGEEFFAWLAAAQAALADPTGADALNASVGLADTLGRALHTIQDNCAHRGVSDAQHAWISRASACSGPLTVLDDDPVAEECAWTQTESLLAQIAPIVVDAGVADMVGQLSCAGWDWGDPCSDETEADVWDICAFLALADTWDGVDRRWNVTVVGPQLESAFLVGAADDLCAVEGLVAPPADPTDVSAGPAECVTYDVMCLGGDSSSSGWACFGCAGARPREGAASAAALLALAGLVLLRRRRPR